MLLLPRYLIFLRCWLYYIFSKSRSQQQKQHAQTRTCMTPGNLLYKNRIVPSPPSLAKSFCVLEYLHNRSIFLCTPP